MNTRAAKHNRIYANSIEVSPAVAKSSSWAASLVAVEAATTVESAPTISSYVYLTLFRRIASSRGSSGTFLLERGAGCGSSDYRGASTHDF